MIALVDCNSFYVSCERLFRPDLSRKPVIVLSNNDGVTISRCPLAKEIGIKMGDPYHLIKETLRHHGVHFFSSNYSLYGDISDRVMRTIISFAQDIEVYSIDEAFLDLTGMSLEYTRYAEELRDTILKNIGIPVSVGIAPTKVLAKVANKIAKKGRGVFVLENTMQIETALTTFDVGDVWGIGSRSAKKLNALGVTNALQFCSLDRDFIRKNYTIVKEKISEELRGTRRFEFESPSLKKQIICSRSFGREIKTLSQLEETVSSYMSRAAEKLRAQASFCQSVRVFIHTNPHKNTPQYYRHACMKIPPTDSTQELIKVSTKLLKTIYKSGLAYKKSGVMISDFTQRKERSLFQEEHPIRQEKVSSVLDAINSKYGRGTIFVGRCGIKKEWKMNSKFCSPSYTTKWSELLEV